jgi:alkylation response protein AidB-like acyl-CoA dehydrogenase
VPKWYRPFGPGEDLKYFKEVISLGNLGSIAFVSGVLLNLFELMQEFVKGRKFRGRPLKENDDVAGVLADIAAEIEVTRIVGYQYARMLDRPDLYGERGSEQIVVKGRMHKYLVCDRGIKALERALNLMGVHGGDRELDIEKHWRDLKIVQLWMGGKQLCQMETARWFFECETL